MADHISDSEISVTVDYNYSGKKKPTEFFIYAFPQNGEGSSMSRNVNTELIPIKTGNNQATFVITKRNESKNFTSNSIKICILEIKRKIYCKEFEFTKSWMPTPTEVNIISFEASTTQINKGESVTLTWQTENANSVNILEKGSTNIQKVEAFGAITFMPDKSTIYILLADRSSAKGIEKQESRSITITVNSAPEIVDFRIEPQNIKRGEQVRFYWQVNNAQKVQLFDSYGEIESRIQLPNGAYGWLLNIDGSYMENLNKSETYILKASNIIGSVEKQVKVSVIGKKID
jgi:hypothetical protein